jgi:hypothetical protein
MRQPAKDYLARLEGAQMAMLVDPKLISQAGLHGDSREQGKKFAKIGEHACSDVCLGKPVRHHEWRQAFVSTRSQRIAD